MLKLLYDLCGDRLVKDMKDRTDKAPPGMRICVVVASPLLHAALAQHGRRNLPQDYELLTADAMADIVECKARDDDSQRVFHNCDISSADFEQFIKSQGM